MVLQIGSHRIIMFVIICYQLEIYVTMHSVIKKKSIIAGLLTLLMVLNLGLIFCVMPADAVSKSQLNALKQQQTQLAAKKASLQAQTEAINEKVASQTEKLNLLAQQLDVTNSELQNLSAQIAIYTNSIAEMENELNNDQQKEQALLVKFRVRVRAMEESGSISYLSILFGAHNFADLISRIDSIQEIMEYDNSLIDQVREAKAKVQSAKTETEAAMAEQQKVFAAYQEKQADLVSQQKAAQTILESLKSNSADYQKQLASVKTLQSSIGGRISDMQAELAEQERIKAEQAAADQIDSQPSSPSNSDWTGSTVQSGNGADIVQYAENFLGVPYVYGGTSPDGFDCSGLVYYCYRHFGYSVNRTAAGLAYSGIAVSKSELRPGDVLLFTSRDGSYVGHAALYIGGGQFIQAPHPGDVVKISSLSEDYYTSHYWGARRIIS